MGGGSGSGKGTKGGGVNAPEVTSNPRFAGNSTLWQQEQGLQNLTSFEQSLINPQVSQANWASNIATGGNVGGFSPWSTQQSPYGFGPHDPHHQSAGYGAYNSFAPWEGGGGQPGVQSATPGSQSAAATQGQNTQSPMTTGGGGNSTLGPYLESQVNALGAAGSVAGQQVAGTNLPSSGIYADQQAMIDAAVKSGKAQIAQQLASEGLSSSTQGKELASELDLQGAATGGQLIQGNIQLAQQGQLEQFGMFSQLAAADSQQQAQMWQEAMQGQGQLGQYLNNILATYGMDMEGLKISSAAELGNAQIQGQAEAANASSGGGGGGGGMGGIGSLIGSVGGLFASGAGGTSAAAGIGTALAGLFGT